jgi:Domain of unknown function (DUF4331)
VRSINTGGLSLRPSPYFSKKSPTQKTKPPPYPVGVLETVSDFLSHFLTNFQTMLKSSLLRLGSALLLTGWAKSASASSHREAPLMANAPLADNTDVYAFRSPENTITLIACYIPTELLPLQRFDTSWRLLQMQTFRCSIGQVNWCKRSWSKICTQEFMRLSLMPKVCRQAFILLKSQPMEANQYRC